MFKAAVVASLAVSASAFNGGFSSDSIPARKLMQASTLIDGRGLGGGNNQNNGNGMYAVISKLHLKYTGCAGTQSLAYGGNGQNNNNNNNNNKNNNAASSGVYNSYVVTFQLSEGCNGPVVGTYATNMMTFVDAFVESTLDEQEWKCENYRETVCQYTCQNNGNNNNGNNNNGNNQNSCYYDCFMSASDTSIQTCAQYYTGEENVEFELQRYLQCDNLKNNNKNNNNNNNNNNNGNNGYSSFDWYAGYNDFPQWDGAYRAGAYCHNNQIFLGVFYDQQCSVKAPTSVYEALNGVALPYTSTSLVPKDACLSCVDAEAEYEYNQKNQNNNGNNNNNANNNNWNNVAPREFCYEAYQYSTKCEDPSSSYMQYLTYGSNTLGCSFLNNYLPQLTRSYSSSTNSASAQQGKVGSALAYVFAATTVLVSGYAVYLHGKATRGGAAGLSHQDGALA